MINWLCTSIVSALLASWLLLMVWPAGFAASVGAQRIVFTLAPASQAQAAGVFLPTLSNVVHPSLAVDGAGGIHMAFEPVSGSRGARMPVQYGYCAADCLRRESWKVVAVSGWRKGKAAIWILFWMVNPARTWWWPTAPFCQNASAL